MTRLILKLMQTAARKTSAKVDAATGVRVATYTPVARGLGWMLLLIAVVGIAFILSQIGLQGVTAAGGIACAAVVALCAAMVLEFTGVRAEWTDSELTFTSPWGGTRQLRWSEVTEIHYSAAAGRFILRGQNGTKVRLGLFMGGITDLLDDLKRRASPPLVAQVEQAMATWRRGTG
jgi:hypothetical protein